MPQFKYIARSRTGEKIEGKVEAQDRRAALLQIERMGQVPVSVSEGGALAPEPAKSKEKKVLRLMNCLKHFSLYVRVITQLK